MRTKEKLINVFRQLVKSATLEELSRERESISVYDFDEKCKKRLSSLQECIPQEIDCSVCYRKGISFHIKLKEFNEEYVHIFPVTAEYVSRFDGYTRKGRGFTFHPKRKKYNELSEIYSNSGLDCYENWDCGYYSSEWGGIAAKKKSYAISYGQIMRELTSDEYHELANLYLDKLCELDLKFLESKICDENMKKCAECGALNHVDRDYCANEDTPHGKCFCTKFEEDEK